ncbi:MAG: hypothetical protein K2O34_06300, partial [Acetatifactor sp.]|nr:hypothetical protein [Acetatifactor sp.]
MKPKKRTEPIIVVIMAVVLLAMTIFGIYRFWFYVKPVYPVSMIFYDVVNQEPLSGVSVVCRRGHSRHVQEEAMTDSEGRVVFDLPEGKYTLDWSVDGYYDGSQNIFARETGMLPVQYLVPRAGWREAYIVAAWDGNADLDLCIYHDQEQRCIGRESLPGDAYVLEDIADKSYELAYLDDYTDGSYTVFIKDYDGAGDTQRVQPEDVDIRIYTAEGLMYHEQTALSELESAESYTALYECARISGQTVEKSERYIEDLTDYPWAARDKNDPARWMEDSVMQAKEVYSYDDAGKLGGITRTQYNESGQVTLDATYNGFGKCIWEHIWIYDDGGAVIKQNTGYYGKDYRYYEAEYDSYGNITLKCNYDKYGSLQGVDRYEYQYDENGNMLARKDFYINGDGEEFITWEAVYDESGELISLHDYGHGVLERQIESEYDENGKLRRRWAGFYNNVRETAVYNIDGDWLEEEYDDQGNMIKYSVYCYNEDGELELDWREEYQYDSAGNEISCRRFDKNGELDWSRKAEYDAAGNQIFCHEFYEYGDGVWDKWWKAEYDSDGRIAAAYTYRGGGKRLTTSER